MSARSAARNRHSQNDRKKTTKILVVDDHPIVREGLANVFQREADFRVCGQAEDRHQTFKLVASTRPDLVVMDLGLKGSLSFELIKDLRLQHPDVQILVVSMHDEKIHAERAIRAGASGYITKDDATIKIVDAVRQVLRGEIYLSQSLSAQLISKLAGHSPADNGSPLEKLTDRELQVFQMVGEGMGRREIARQLNLDVNTVETYRARIREKLYLADARELLQFAIKYRHEVAA